MTTKIVSGLNSFDEIATVEIDETKKGTDKVIRFLD